MNQPHIQLMDKIRKDYILEITSGAFKYIEDHVDQNIENVHTTYFNVLAEMLAAFVMGFDEKDHERIIIKFIDLSLNKLEFYHKIKENLNEK